MSLQSLILKIDSELELRQLSERDGTTLFDLTDKNRRYLRQWLPWLDDTTSVIDTLQFINAVTNKASGNSGYTFGILHCGVLAGVIAQHQLDRANRAAELGYWLDEDRQGLGIMTRAAERLVEFAFDNQYCNRVVLRCAAENLKSRGIPERLGFVQEGVLRDAEWLYDHFVDLAVYSMLKRDWTDRSRAQSASS